MSVINEDLIELIITHCSATKEGEDFTAENINQWHKDRGFAEIGYQFVIRLNGRIEIGRDLDERGAHVKGYNTNSWGICYIGGLDWQGNPKDTRTWAQKESMKMLWRLLGRMAINAKYAGHRDMPGVHKDCPCFDVASDLPWDLRDRAYRYHD